ncbi:MAG: dUTP diphosphatase [Planctomycetes bacterium]|nr:dUTP diphosphatase [Planctomycetota bacterium]
MSDTAQPTLAVKRLDPRAALPRYQSAGAAGMDLAACLPESTPSIWLEPGAIRPIPTGIAIAVPLGFEAQVRPRSGLSTKHGITLPNAPGTIDSDYRGEVLVPLINLGKERFEITHGMRIAQMVIAPVVQAVIAEASELSATQRGAGGFGSTGRH